MAWGLGCHVFSREGPTRFNTLLTVADDTPTSIAICLPVQRRHRSAMKQTAISSQGSGIRRAGTSSLPVLLRTDNLMNAHSRRVPQRMGRGGVFRDYRLRIAHVLRDYSCPSVTKLPRTAVQHTNNEDCRGTTRNAAVSSRELGFSGADGTRDGRNRNIS